MKKLHILLSICLVLFISQINGQVFTNYTVENTSGGLASDTVLAIAVDEEDNIWFGTEKGVSKFDSQHWTTNSSDRRITGISIDNQNNIWLLNDKDPHAMNGNCCKYNDSTGCNWPLVPSFGRLYTAFAIDTEDNVWIAWYNVINRTSGVYGEDTTYFVGDSEHINSIAIDKEGSKWFGTSAGVSKFDGTNWITYDTLGGLTSNKVQSIAIDADGSIWFGCGYSLYYPITTSGEGVTGGVTKFDGENWTTYTDSNTNFVYDEVVAIAIDTEDNKWFCYNKYRASPGVGMFLQDSWVSKFDGSTWTNYTTDSGLIDNHVNAIAVDADNNIWIGTEGGVSKLSSPTVIKPTIKNNHQLSIYPNPTNSLFTIESEQPGFHSIEITSFNGQLIYKGEMEGPTYQIDISSFSKGVYFVTVRSKEFVRTEKIVKL